MVRPNKDYIISAYDPSGVKYETALNSNDYVKQGNEYAKSLSLINIPLSQKELSEKKERAAALLALEKSKMSTVFAKTIDSLMSLTKDYVVLHHPFDQVYIVQKDLNEYYKIIERAKRMHDKEIVIVSATDCNGSNEYNENLSEQRARRIYKTLSALSDNHVSIKHVGERELLKACDDLNKSIDEQEVNRYSFVFIINRK
jgi:outer membrane protein OmpA-like peptidoglycan-associated protein